MDEENTIPPSAPENGPLGNLVQFIWDLLKILIISFAIILPVRYFLAQPFIVSGSSMEPTFHSGEYLIIDELSYHLHAPQRGDVIVFKYPKDTSQYYIKRIIGLPGDEVRVSNGHVEIIDSEWPQGHVLNEPYLISNNITFVDTDTKLGSGEYFVLGDNRPNSSDSRYWGPVPTQDIVGKVFLRAFPFQNFTDFENIHYSY